MFIQNLPYLADSCRWFELLRELQWPIFLDSGSGAFAAGRYDILTAAPTVRLITRGAKTWVKQLDATTVVTADPWSVIQHHQPPFLAETVDLPFVGGALGFCGYELGQPDAVAATGLPQMMVGIYRWALIVDHQLQCTTLLAWSEADLPLPLTAFQSPPAVATDEFYLVSAFAANMDFAEYRQAFDRIQAHILAGDCYQINLTQQFQAEWRGSLWQGYQQLRAVNPAPFGGFLQFDELQILCCSPERFITCRAGDALTQPIKGTRPRSADAVRDQAMIEALQHSEKDRAENVMIVDLLRNDFGRCCVPGSIRVPQLFQVQSFAAVHHLVSTVSGTLAPAYTALDLLRACFPGGSITGAPKIKAMSIIKTLEKAERGPYCGSVFYYDVRGHLDSNIAIRTLTQYQGHLTVAAGGGIVADSTCSAEHAELMSKVDNMLGCFTVKPHAQSL